MNTNFCSEPGLARPLSLQESKENCAAHESELHRREADFHDEWASALRWTGFLCANASKRQPLWRTVSSSARWVL